MANPGSHGNSCYNGGGNGCTLLTAHSCSSVSPCYEVAPVQSATFVPHIFTRSSLIYCNFLDTCVVPWELWHCWLVVGKSIRPVNIEWRGAGMVVHLEWGADDLHIWSCWIHYHPVISCFINPQCFVSLVPAYPGCPAGHQHECCCCCCCCFWTVTMCRLQSVFTVVMGNLQLHNPQYCTGFKSTNSQPNSTDRQTDKQWSKQYHLPPMAEVIKRQTYINTVLPVL